MNRNIIRIAAVAALGLVAAQGAFAATTTSSTQAYVGGSGENESVAYAGAVPQGSPLAPATISGTGENISVELPAPVLPAPSGYVAVIDGTGENQSVRYLPVTPRG
ncbi:hypothetical protein AAFN86_11550 [Roseomonas sp. CAU 1739]|uniref:hypothetical protein n=1 Tax=Roseomonas sp. CAU 1739 TaxID=3140364 RepID=UPI00325B923A